MLCVTPWLWLLTEGWDRRGEVVVGEHLLGLEMTGSQGGSSSLGSPQVLHLHLAQPLNTLGKARAPTRGRGQRAQ